MVFPSRLAAALAGVVVSTLALHARDYRVTLGAAEVDRAAQVIGFKLPADAPQSAVLRGPGGAELPVQVGAGGEATFVLPRQKAGESVTLTLTAAGGERPRGVDVRQEAGRLSVRVEGREAFVFQTDREATPRPGIKPEFKRAGYIHPVYSPAGKIVTDDYPSNHVHHHGIWTPWVKTKFQGRAPDFWNMGAKTGAEDFVALERTWEGAVHGGFVARLQMVDLSAPRPVVALHETWRVTSYRVVAAAGEVPVNVFDLEVTQTCATPDALGLPQYHYGGFGLRGADAWNGPGDAALFLTSEGISDRVAGNNTRGRWCYLGGRLDGAIAGTAVLGHPGNFRAPQPLRLHPNMPYFSYVPQQLGEFAIEPGRAYVARFRFVAADGAPDPARLDAFWHGYARPATVSLAPAP
jgi:hypothetical protein